MRAKFKGPYSPTQMQNGAITLAIRVTLPADQNKQPDFTKPHPVILIQTAYNTGFAGQIADMASGPNPEFVRRAYATVVRGTGSSEGLWLYLMVLNSRTVLKLLTGPANNHGQMVILVSMVFLI
nr:CocE/NonD family hydrolase [Acinetobacter schindleri]